MYIREATMDDLENLTERDKKVTQDELYNAINVLHLRGAKTI